MKHRIEPQSGAAFTIDQGQYLVVTDPIGEQVSDLVCFNRHDRREWLSSGKTLDYCSTLLITQGHALYSNRSNVMFDIVEDTNGRNDFLLAPCSPETFEIIYDNHAYHPSCFENLHTNLASYGITPDDIPTAFNLFMNVQFVANGTLTVAPPTSRAGDRVVLQAKMDLIVGLTACSAEQSNNYAFKPIDYEVTDAL